MAAAHETHVVGQPLPQNPLAQRAALAAIAADMARFRAQQPAGGRETGADASPVGHDAGVPLNWGPEGDEGPLLAIGASIQTLK